VKWRAAAFAVVVAASSLGTGAAAQANDRDEPTRLLEFGDTLLRRGESYRAITEYLRFESYFPTDSRTAELPLRVGLAYVIGGHPDSALEALAPAASSERGEIRSRATYLQGRAYYEAGEWELAMRSWASGITGPEVTLARRGRLLSLLHLERREEAVGLLRSGEASGLEVEEAQSLAERMSTAPQPKKRSPGLAGALSIVPGAGQLYAGRPRDALVAFLLNGLFILGAVQAFENDNEATGIILTTVEAGWYTGNIVSAVSGARRYNEIERDRYLDRVAGVPTLEARNRAEELDVLLGVKIRF
jgi:tetratricopeptide (TPR) repeat protein